MGAARNVSTRCADPITNKHSVRRRALPIGRARTGLGHNGAVFVIVNGQCEHSLARTIEVSFRRTYGFRYRRAQRSSPGIGRSLRYHRNGPHALLPLLLSSSTIGRCS